MPTPPLFDVKDCALISLATGKRAQNLRELSLLLSSVPAESIYHHFWGGLLRPQFDDPEYLNDFAAWAQRGLHDYRLAERLAIIDPTEFDNLEDLRRELIEVIEARMDESEMVPWAKIGQQFHFGLSQIVVFETGTVLNDPLLLAGVVPRLSSGSVFYHMIDARRRNAEKVDDFSRWLMDCAEEYQPLIQKLSEIDPYFGSLTDLRRQLTRVMVDFFAGDLS